ncbi:T9SS C-terminal target domain-containing protein [candidate division KSB1 bacterium]|nr:T9SS type A sorting domain-containing protein [candidate division KSB1 bacterium]RQW07145.1 MAG: T9SS C-terminal target domain-containing protein [candidate division KSB1 bacterium]
MKVTLLLFTLAILLTPLLAQDVHLFIQKTDTAPRIDAIKDDVWNGANHYSEFNVIEGEPQDEFDCSPTFCVLWDETYLYYYVKVVDDFLNVDESSEDLRNPNGGWGWADDCVELYLDGDNSKEAKWSDEKDAAQLWWLPFGYGIYFYQLERFHMDTTNIVYAYREMSEIEGWELEVAIPLEDAGIPAQAGSIFGFEVDIGDDDGVPFAWRPGSTGGRDLKLKWFYTEDKTEPVYFANAQLSDEIVSTVGAAETTRFGSFYLSPNYPNPFNPKTTIRYQLTAAAHVRLDVFDVRGARIKTLVDAGQQAGEYSVDFDGADLPSAIYLYQLVSGKNVQIRKMALSK